MTLEELEAQVHDGEVDTVLVALTDMQGRLQGKRLTARHFLDEVARHGAEACNYLLAVDVDMNTVVGLRDVLVGARLRGLRDEARPRDAAPGPLAPGHGDVPGRPAVGRRQPGRRLAAPDPSPPARSPAPSAAGPPSARTELEFLIFRTPYEEAFRRGYRDLEPANLYNVDYSLLGTARVEPLIRRIRNEMGAAGLVVENSKGECNLGQHEINFRYADVLRTADEHAIFKNGAKEIAAQEGMAITLHGEVRRARGQLVPHPPLAAPRRRLGRCSTTSPRRSTASSPGCSATLRELTLFLAPNVNSYKRYRRGLVRPDGRRVGPRQPHVRAARRRPRARAARRVPRPGRRRQPVPRAQRDHRRRPARRRRGARAGAAARGQRVRLRPPARPAHPARSARPLRRQRGGPGGVRRGGRGPLPQRRARSSSTPSSAP